MIWSTNVVVAQHLGPKIGRIFFFAQSVIYLKYIMYGDTLYSDERIGCSKTGKLNGIVLLLLLAMKASTLIFLTIHYMIQRLHFAHLPYPQFVLSMTQLECWLLIYHQMHAALFNLDLSVHVQIILQHDLVE